MHPWPKNRVKIKHNNNQGTSQNALDSCPRCNHIQGELYSNKQPQHLICVGLSAVTGISRKFIVFFTLNWNTQVVLTSSPVKHL